MSSQLDGIARKWSLYQMIAAALANSGYERTWQQCKVNKRPFSEVQGGS